MCLYKPTRSCKNISSLVKLRQQRERWSAWRQRWGRWFSSQPARLEETRGCNTNNAIAPLPEERRSPTGGLVSSPSVRAQAALPSWKYTKRSASGIFLALLQQKVLQTTVPHSTKLRCLPFLLRPRRGRPLLPVVPVRKPLRALCRSHRCPT